jgi:hypothetical protein
VVTVIWDEKVQQRSATIEDPDGRPNGFCSAVKATPTTRRSFSPR